MSAETMILDVAPAPNQMTKSGAMATMGMDCEATMYGATSRSTVRERESR